MEKRLNIERAIENAPFKAKIGAVNRINPVSVYITGKAYISPLDDKENYAEEISLLESDLRRISRRYTTSQSFLNKELISNLELPKNSLKQGKNTFMFFQIFFSQKFGNPVCKNIDEIKKKMLPGIKDVLEEFKSKIEERGFTIYEKRRS